MGPDRVQLILDPPQEACMSMMTATPFDVRFVIIMSKMAR
jgi:hypothetical protein